MKYYICFQNCIDDYFSEDAPSLEFDSFDSAIRYLTSLTEDSPIPTPNPDGELKWYFPNCSPNGIIQEANLEEDWLDFYQIINIIPEDANHKTICECYCDDPFAIISMRRNYMLDSLGKTHNICLSEIEYINTVEN